MKKTLLILLVFAISNTFSYAQSSTETVQQIREQYKIIRNQLGTFDTIQLEVWEESTEGSLAIAHYSHTDLKMITVTSFGETGKNLVEYYFNDGELFFAFSQDYRYNRPIYWDKKTAKENGDTQFFDAKKSIITENRYYFQNTHLFLWLNNNKQEVDLALSINQLKAQEIINHANQLKSRFKKP